MLQDINNFIYETFVAKFDLWVIVGLGAQLMFTGRFLVQWISSERAGKSVIPLAFWFFSVAGGALTMIYGIAKREPVIIFGQFLAMLIYLRNLVLIFKNR
ncbi:lipid-A-disaccharide synthase-like uncharacterized protein [Nitrobacteraceae bacterium AZCC 1564]